MKLGTRVILTCFATIVLAVLISLAGYLGLSGATLAVLLVAGSVLALAMGFYLYHSVSAGISGLVAECSLLAQAVREGKLDFRADASRHEGEFRKIIEEFNNTLDALVGPLNVAAEYVDRISKGDIPPKITDEYYGDFNEIKNNLNTCIDSINSVIAGANNLYEAHDAGDIDFYIPEEQFSGAFRQMVTGINKAVRMHVGDIIKFLKVLKSYAEGDFNPVLEKRPGKRGYASIQMDLIRNNLQSLIKEINNMVQAVRDGKLETRCNASDFAGDWGNLLGGMNSLMEAVAEPVDELMVVLGRMAVNDFTQNMVKDYSGVWNDLKAYTNRVIEAVTSVEKTTKKISGGDLSDLDMLKEIGRRSDNDELVPAYIQMMEAVKDLVADVDMIAEAVVDGNLSIRADAARHGGDFRKVVEGLNRTMDAVAEPVDEMMAVLARVSVNDVTRKMEKEYKGVWNDLKEGVNSFIRIITHIQNTVIHISNGDLSDLEIDRKIGRRCENDELMPAMIKMMESIRRLTDDATMLTGAAIAGKLDVRADVTRHEGEYRKIIEEFNNTLDALIGPLNVAAEYVDRISKGDIPPKITDEYNGDFNEIKNNLNTCIDSLNSVVASINDLYEAQSAGDADFYIPEEQFSGVYQQMAAGVNKSVRLHVRNALKILKVVAAYAEGDFSKVLEKLPGKQAIANEKTDLIRNNLLSLIGEINNLVLAVREGRLDARGNAAAFSGDWGKLVGEMNGLMEAVTEPVNELMAVLGRMAVNDFTLNMAKDYSGAWNDLKTYTNRVIEAVTSLEKTTKKISNGDLSDLDMLKEIGRRSEKDELVPAYIQMMETIQGMVNEANSLIQAVREGRLDARGNAAAFSGEWGRLVSSMNGLMEAVAQPVNELIVIQHQMSVNDLSKKMENEYAGIWNELKTATNDVQHRLTNIHRTIDKISRGDLSDAEMYKKIGRRSEKDDLVPALIRMHDAIQRLLDDANYLAGSAVDGNLGVRADASRHDGEYRKIIEGVNKMLDAVINPINEAAGCLKEMANGNLNVRVNGNYKGDHAIIKDALNTTLDTLQKVIQEETGRCLKEMAAGNLDVAVTGDYKGDYAKIKDDVNKFINNLNDSLGQIAIAIEQVSTGAFQVSDSSQSLSQGAAESASALGQITTSMHEINSQTKQNAENALQANQLATQARNIAEQGNEQMALMVKAMSDINESAANISKIIKAIDEIAFQTNILALNAAVEAARAGKHGKGFTVVAEEVRNLAQRSAKAARETAEMIEGSIKKTEIGAKIAEETSRALEEIVHETARVTDLIGEIAAASKEQALGIEQINGGLNQVDQVIQQNSASSEELAAASEEMSSQAAMVKQMLDKFKLRNQGFAVTGERAGIATTKLYPAYQRPGQRQSWGSGSKPVKPGALEAAATKDSGVNPQEIISLNDAEFGNF